MLEPSSKSPKFQTFKGAFSELCGPPANREPSFESTQAYIQWWKLQNEARSDGLVRVNGRDFWVPASIFSPDPGLTNSSAMMIARVRIAPGSTVLDIGAGCGILGIFAALNGAEVLATDIDPHCAAVVAANAARNHCSNRVTFKQSDLFKNVNRKFDVILANLPIVDSAWKNLKFPVVKQLEAFLTGLPAFLTPRGVAHLSFAEFGDTAMVRALLNKSGYAIAEITESRFGIAWSLFRISAPSQSR